MAKCALKVVGQEAKEACGMDQLCRRVEVGTEGVITTMHLLWKQHAQKEGWMFFLIDAQNAFN